VTSIRKRTTLIVAGTLACVLIVGGGALYVVVRRALTAQFDSGLAAHAEALRSLVKFEAGCVAFDSSGEVLVRYGPSADAEYFTVWSRADAGWQTLQCSESLRGQPWEIDPAGLAVARGFDRPLTDGRSGRALLIEFRPNEEPDHRNAPVARAARETASPVLRLLVARSRAGLDRTLATIGLSLLGAGAAMLIATIVAARWAVARGLSPLTDLARHIGTISPDSLDQRLPSADLPRELVPITDRLNDAILRLDSAFARERRFTGAASHELRTPLTELRTMLEVALSQPRTAERWERTARESLGATERAQRLVAALLSLARARGRDANASSHDGDAGSDIAATCRELVRKRLEADPAHQSCIEIDAPGVVMARVDPAVSESILRNLIDNALTHGDVSDGSPVRVLVRAEGEFAVASVANRAPDLTDAEVPRLFEPFWRKDAARSGECGFGLGLSVCASLAESCGGSASAMLDKCGTLSVQVCLPLGAAR